MGPITTPDPIYASDINNFQGELFKVGGQRTPFLSAMGGLTGGGKVIQSTFFQFQTADNATISSAPTEGTEGGAPTKYLGRNRGAYTQVTQIFHKGVKMSYTAMAAYNQQNPLTLGAAGSPASDGDGTFSWVAQTTDTNPKLYTAAALIDVSVMDDTATNRTASFTHGLASKNLIVQMYDTVPVK